jgi:hypothetical protein
LEYLLTYGIEKPERKGDSYWSYLKESGNHWQKPIVHSFGCLQEKVVAAFGGWQEKSQESDEVV